jgi:hypothetical protein
MTLEGFHHVTVALVRMPAFPLGRIVITTNALQTIPPDFYHCALARHAAGDWGELSAEDAAQNDEALRDGDGRLFSAYAAGNSRFWIITEADRSVTTILRPEDY